MFEAFDPERDLNSERLVPLRSSISGRTPLRRPPSEAVVTVLEAGFRARIMSYRSAYELGARSGMSLADMKRNSEACAGFIHAGLGCAVDETLFAALVFHFPDLAKDLSRCTR